MFYSHIAALGLDLTAEDATSHALVGFDVETLAAAPDQLDS